MKETILVILAFGFSVWLVTGNCPQTKEEARPQLPQSQVISTTITPTEVCQTVLTQNTTPPVTTTCHKNQ